MPKIRFHDLRHTHATLLQDKDVNIKIVCEGLGHSKIKITLNKSSRVLRTMPEDTVNKIE
ncbi:tyrosine-type recombinase/integrase [Bacillus cereus]|uniref:tyrosine-type recombinase/integrase n=1 Tax=Bacillus cereus TaxID=1396 RepID=UPI0020D27A9C|nr:tyrosine-type recombinase/integrase [Bacillus cereus]